MFFQRRSSKFLPPKRNTKVNSSYVKKNMDTPALPLKKSPRQQIPGLLFVCVRGPERVGSEYPPDPHLPWYLHWTCYSCKSEFRIISTLVSQSYDREKSLSIQCPFCVYDYPTSSPFKFSDTIQGEHIIETNTFSYHNPTPKTKKCTKCGSETQPNWKVCPMCATSL